FDGQNQMPRLSRFLFGAWLKAEDGGRPAVSTVEPRSEVGDQWSGSYTDWEKARHKRSVLVEGNRWRITDEIDGSFSTATLRWRLAPGEWKLEGNTCVGEHAKLTISDNISPECIKLAEGWESRYYMKKTPLPVLEITIPDGTNTITTEIHLD
ncbi:MAG: heparinase II/III family protein, partial [Holophagae bacterium]|nr:heparinase II/III family protein [Holophagae bacterium]